jgi:hypothetical protein
VSAGANPMSPMVNACRNFIGTNFKYIFLRTGTTER